MVALPERRLKPLRAVGHEYRSCYEERGHAKKIADAALPNNAAD
jgi:hypothetical protein